MIMNADEAAKMIEKDREFLMEKQLGLLNDLIRCACYEGRDEIIVKDYELLQDTVDRLRDLGYIVKINILHKGWYIDTTYVIRWNFPFNESEAIYTNETMYGAYGTIYEQFKTNTGISSDMVLDWRPVNKFYTGVDIEKAIDIQLKNGGRIIYTTCTDFHINK